MADEIEAEDQDPKGPVSQHAGDQYSRGGAWRRLGVFWLSVALLMSIGTGVIEWAGTPAPAAKAKLVEQQPVQAVVPEPPKIAQMPRVETPPPPVVVAEAAPPKPAPAPVEAPAATGERIVAAPDPALLEPADRTAPAGAKDHLPRISADGRTPMRVYAAAAVEASGRPRVALLLAGIGLNEADSEAAIRTLPAAVSLAVSPYAASHGGSPAGMNLPRMLASARAAGHEYLVALPLEPTGFPLNDPGPATLLTSAPPSTNLTKLHWALSRMDGYAGVTGIVGTMRGERLAAMADQMDAVLTELASRGLMYIDPREGSRPVSKTWGRHVDFVIDDIPERAAIDSRLAALEQRARDSRVALGLMMRPTPVALIRTAAWAYGLAERGIVLTPVSALALPPKDAPQASARLKVTERDK